MIPPRFDAGVAINQLVSALYTLLGVFAGGFLAFRLGLRQLRSARAIDRRVEWTEQLHDAVATFQSDIAWLVHSHEPAPAERDRDWILEGVASATRSGRELQTLLGRADFYGSVEERDLAGVVKWKEMLARVALLDLEPGDPSKVAAAIAVLQGVEVELREAKAAFANLVRDELGLERLGTAGPTMPHVGRRLTPKA